MKTEIELPFADGVYAFRLGLAQIDELQRKCDAGIGAIYARLLKGRYINPVDGGTFGAANEATYRMADVHETIRQALIGGARGTVNEQPVQVTAHRATELVTAYVAPAAPLAEGWTLASRIMSALIDGYEDPTAKKKDLKGETASSTTPRRSRSAAKRASSPAKSAP